MLSLLRLHKFSADHQINNIIVKSKMRSSCENISMSIVRGFIL